MSFLGNHKQRGTDIAILMCLGVAVLHLAMFGLAMFFLIKGASQQGATDAVDEENRAISTARLIMEMEMVNAAAKLLDETTSAGGEP